MLGFRYFFAPGYGLTNDIISTGALEGSCVVWAGQRLRITVGMALLMSQSWDPACGVLTLFEISESL
jgi:hypothetical protein